MLAAYASGCSIAAQKGKGLYGGQQRSINHKVLRHVQIFDSRPTGLPG